MPKTKRMRSGSTIANSTTATPRSSRSAPFRKRLKRFMTGSWGRRRTTGKNKTVCGRGTEQWCAPTAEQDLQRRRDRRERSVDLAAKCLDGTDDDGGNECHQKAVLNA